MNFTFSLFGYIKGTVSVLSSDPFQRYPSNMLKIPSFSSLEKCLFLWDSPLLLINKKCVQATFAEKLQMKKKQFKETKTCISIHTWLLSKVPLLSLHGLSLEITLTVPLSSVMVQISETAFSYSNPKKHPKKHVLKLSMLDVDQQDVRAYPPLQPMGW